MSVTMYTTHCPRCNVLKKKLELKGLEFTEVDNIAELQEKGITEVPTLEVDERRMSFMEAVNWVNALEEQKAGE